MYNKVSLCLWTSAIILLQASKRSNGLKYPAVITFGDSIADTGNNNYIPSLAKCNYLPYGRDFPGGIPTGRWTNAKSSSDFLAQQLGIKEFLPAYNDRTLRPEDLVTGVSFASGASGYDPLTSQYSTAISLAGQLALFKEYQDKLKTNIGEDAANELISKAFYGIISSSNDIANTYFGTHVRQLQMDFSSYSDFLVDKASEFVQELYAAGARQINVFGAPAVGCMPFSRTAAGGIRRQCNEEYNEAAQMFNSKLNSLLTTLSDTLSGANLRYVDIYQPLLQVIQNHQSYGFGVEDRGCCGTGNVEVWILCDALTPACTNASNYVFWDSYHPTERAYQVLLSIIFQNNNNFGLTL